MNGGCNGSGDIENDDHDLVEVKDHEYSCIEVCQEPERCRWVSCLIARVNLYQLMLSTQVAFSWILLLQSFGRIESDAMSSGNKVN